MGWALVLAGLGAPALALAAALGVAAPASLPVFQQAIGQQELRGSGYSVRIMRGGREIEISGEFAAGLNSTFVRALREAPAVETVHLTSIGGRIAEGESVRDTIRSHGLDTYVSDYCASACTLAFMGGRERWINRNARMGFHSFAMGRGWGWVPVALFIDEYHEMYLETGVESGFVEHIFAIPNEEVWHPTFAELAAAGVTTGIAAIDQFAVSGLGPDTSVKGLTDTLADLLPWLAALRDREPATFRSLVVAVRDAYLDGVTESRFGAILRTHFLPALRAHLPRADDATMIAFGELLIAQYQYLLGVEPDVCAAYALGTQRGGEASSFFPQSLVDEEVALGERVLRSSADRPSLAAATADQYWSDVMGRVFARPGMSGLDTILFGSPSWVAGHGRQVCAFSIAVFEEVLDLGEPRTSALLRANFRQLGTLP